MAMSVAYTTINGQIVHENRGGVEAFYAPDTLGSTVALLSTTGAVTDTYTYQPYGEIVSHVGSSVTPFTFVGTLGYYLDILGSQIYVRARYLRQALTRWQTLDPVWPWQLAYVYVNASPVVNNDRSGLGQQNLGSGFPNWGGASVAGSYKCGRKIPRLPLLRYCPFFDEAGWEEIATDKYCKTCLALCLTECATEGVGCDTVCLLRSYMCNASEFPPSF